MGDMKVRYVKHAHAKKAWLPCYTVYFQGVESTPKVLFCQGSTPRNLQLASRKEEACLYTE